MESKYIVAIEIGSSKIKGAVGTYDDSNNLTVLTIEEEKLSADNVRYGAIQNVDQVSNTLTNVCKRLEDSYSVRPHKINSVYTSIGGRSMRSIVCEVTKQYNDEIKITDELYESLKNEARQKCPEGLEVVGVVTRDYIIDNISYNKNNAVGVFGRNIKATFTLITCRPSLKRNIDRVFVEKLNLTVNNCIVRPLAQAELVLSEEEKSLGCMFIDLGAETVSCVIYKNGRLEYEATLPMGSRNITRDLMALNITEDRAEETKKAVGNAYPASEQAPAELDIKLDNSEINKLINARAGEIISNIVEQITYAGLKPADLPSGIIIVGGGAKLKGFCDLLATQSKMNVRVGSPSGLIRMSNANLQPHDSVDIISILSEAIKNNPKECMTLDDSDNDYRDNQSSTYDDDRDEDSNVSRIGGDFDKFETKTKKEKPRKTVKPKPQRDNFDEDYDDEEKEEQQSRRNPFAFIASLKDRVVRVMKEEDSTDDQFDSDED